MNYIRHLTAFFEKVAPDQVLNPHSYQPVYSTLSVLEFQPVSAIHQHIPGRDHAYQQDQLQSHLSQVSPKNLHALGYINYQPSYNPFKGSQVYMLNFSDELETRQQIQIKY